MKDLSGSDTATVVMSAIDLTEEQQQRITAAGGRTVPYDAGNPHSSSALADVEVWLGDGLTDELVARAPRLAWVQSTSQGVDGILSKALVRSAALVTNVSGMHSAVVADHTLALVLALARSLPASVNAQANRTWVAADPSGIHILQGSEMVVVGTGRIGCEVARRGVACGLRVVGVNRRGLAVEGFEEVHAAADLADVVTTADWVVLACPLTRATLGIVNADVLARMKPTSFLVNIARGPVVDSRALRGALDRGELAGAALDVFDEEPLRPDDTFWTLPNVLVTPHVGGVMPNYLDKAIGYFVDNLTRYRSGLPLNSLVDKTAGY